MKRQRFVTVFILVAMIITLAGLSYAVSARPLNADKPGLGAAGKFSVLGFSAVTNSGPSSTSKSAGVWSGTSFTGLDQMTIKGEVHIGDDVAKAAHDAAASADGNMLSQAVTKNLGALGGLTLVPGVYDLGAGSLSGTLTLNGEGVYIFRTTSDLTSSGSVKLTGGARGCDVFWHVATQANLTGGSFVGTIIAGSGIVFGTGVSLNGRALALGGPVTLLSNKISGPDCAEQAENTPTSGGPTNTKSPVVTAQPTNTRSPGGTEVTNTPPPVGGLPPTGGAPLQNNEIPWNLIMVVVAGIFISIVLAFVIRAYRRTYRL